MAAVKTNLQSSRFASTVSVSFVPIECRDSHPRSKAMKGHRMTAFNEIKDEDVQEILRRPQLCQEKSHTSAVLEYFCKTCQRCICQKCTTIIHKNHELEHLDEAAEQAKSRLEETEAKVRERADVWKERIKKDQETHRKIKEQIEAARQAIQHNTQTLIQRFIQVAKQHEKEMLTQVATRFKIVKRESFEIRKRIRNFLWAS